MVLADRRYSGLLTKQHKLLKEVEKTGSIVQVGSLCIGEGFELEVANSLAYRGQARSIHKRRGLDIPKYSGEERRRRAADRWE